MAVASSGMEAGGEGVFAVTRLPAATLAAVFNGYTVELQTKVREDFTSKEKQHRRPQLAFSLIRYFDRIDS